MTTKFIHLYIKILKNYCNISVCVHKVEREEGGREESVARGVF
jgi:hypothetical protein